ncbi:hypothetical protein ABZ749_00905 [Micromonospora sp. NPDC047753]|uniref:hypothetical protein n=1 Tax=Micromonospora sp. NPDC047753 TaxID=3154817 RepID=UPI0033D21088
MHRADTDIDIDLELDEPQPVTTPGVVAPACLITGGLVLLAAGVASFTGHLTLESKAFPLLLALLFILGVIATTRRPTNH